MKKNILENRVYKNKKYKLVETLDNLENEQLINESTFDVMNLLYRLVHEFSVVFGDEVTFQAGGLLYLPARLSTNIIQLWRTNKKAVIVLQKYKGRNDLNEKEINELLAVRKKLGRDIGDIFSAFFSAFPVPFFDNIIQIAIEVTPSLASEKLLSLITGISEGENKLARIMRLTPIPDSAKYFHEINVILVNNNANPGFLSESNEIHDDSEESFEEIDLEEFASLSGGSIGGHTGPLGDEKRKNISADEYLQTEQIERMRILEAYHQRTSNRLK